MKKRIVKITDIHRYLSGEASQEEKDELEAWLEKSDENRRVYNRIREIYSVEISYRHTYDTEKALIQFRRVMESSGQGAAVNKNRFKAYSRPKRRSGAWLKAAAVLLTLFGISIYLLTSYEFDSADQTAEVVSGTTIETEAGEQKTFRLQDGSRVRLNSSSEIYIPTGFGKESRDLVLSGEAFFEVASGHDYEFSVETSSARVSVLGTSFTVRAWQERDESVIAVQTGRVAVHSTNPEITESTNLSAGEYTQIVRGQAPQAASQHNIEQFTAWTQQMFVFEQTPLKDVLRQLELHFNVNISVMDSSSIDEPVTARYRDESLDEILKYTSITHGVEFKVESLNNNK
jgi:transmembrane sensor